MSVENAKIEALFDRYKKEEITLAQAKTELRLILLDGADQAVMMHIKDLGEEIASYSYREGYVAAVEGKNYDFASLKRTYSSTIETMINNAIKGIVQ